MSKVSFVSNEKFPSEKDRRIARLIRRARGELSQAEFAEMLNLSRSALSSYENVTRRPDYYNLCKVAEVSQFSIEELERGLSYSDAEKEAQSNLRIGNSKIDEVFRLATTLLTFDAKKEVIKKIDEAACFSSIPESDIEDIRDACSYSLQMIDKILKEHDALIQKARE